MKRLIYHRKNCINCGACCILCPTGAISGNHYSGRKYVNLSLCIGCNRCAVACTFKCISIGGGIDV